jgi:hypothetical protein
MEGLVSILGIKGGEWGGREGRESITVGEYGRCGRHKCGSEW